MIGDSGLLFCANCTWKNRDWKRKQERKCKN